MPGRSRGRDPPRHRPPAPRARQLGRGPARPRHRADRLAPPGPRAPLPADRRRRRRRLCDRRPARCADSAGASSLRRRSVGTLPIPSRPGPTWAPRTAPISETKTGSQPKISRPSSISADGRLVVLDVLDDPAVGALLVALAGVVAQPLDRAGAGADPLDRGDLLLEREDRLDLQGASRSRRGRRRCGRRGAGTRGCRSRTTSSAPRGSARRGRGRRRRRPPASAAAEAPSTAEAHPAGRRARVEDVDPLAALAFVDEPLAGLARRPRRCRRCRPRCGSRRSPGRRRAAARRRR